MKPKELLEALQNVMGLSTDSAIARLIGLTSGRVSQWRSSKRGLSARQVANLVKRVASSAGTEQLENAIRPIVELYPVDCVASKQDARWLILPTDKRKYPRQYKLRKHLEKAKGIYFFYNSEGEVVYVGQTQKRSLWKRMNETFNREAQSHQAYVVRHPSTETILFQRGISCASLSSVLFICTISLPIFRSMR